MRPDNDRHHGDNGPRANLTLHTTPSQAADAAAAAPPHLAPLEEQVLRMHLGICAPAHEPLGDKACTNPSAHKQLHALQLSLLRSRARRNAARAG